MTKFSKIKLNIIKFDQICIIKENFNNLLKYDNIKN